MEKAKVVQVLKYRVEVVTTQTVEVLVPVTQEELDTLLHSDLELQAIGMADLEQAETEVRSRADLLSRARIVAEG